MLCLLFEVCSTLYLHALEVIFFFSCAVSLPLFSLPFYHPSPCVLLDATLNEINEFHTAMLVLDCVCMYCLVLGKEFAAEMGLRNTDALK